MGDEANTRPTIETVLERLQDFRSSVEVRLDAIEDRLEQLETRMDRTQGIALETRADLRELRADLRAQFKQPA
jgi:chaperonin cofactor prefoldin